MKKTKLVANILLGREQQHDISLSSFIGKLFFTAGNFSFIGTGIVDLGKTIFQLTASLNITPEEDEQEGSEI